MNVKTIGVLTIFLFSILITQCAQTESKSDTQPKTSHALAFNIETDSIVITWEAPTEDPDSVEYYELGYQPIGSGVWTTLKSDISPTERRITVFRSELQSDSSAFFIAVRSVSLDGSTSAWNTSADLDASPPNWYVVWEKK